MLTENEKYFFAVTARAVQQLSTCTEHRGAVLVRGNKILSTGYNRKIIFGKDWEASAIFDVIFSARDVDMTGAVIFCSHFPDLEDIKLIIISGINHIYFFGEYPGLGDPVVDLLNSLNSNSILLQISQLQ